ncbi:MAG: heme-binding protein [Rhodospirillales bacterium]|nr:heme-binding protein [Rhodospirillales bacterium]MCW8951986.1 heme-binding protein [Rhodospirillales bacterium]MCW9001809.1 heme-binding protein [Rhodospirillales bacterium]
MLNIERLSLDDATALLDGAESRAQEIGVPMCIAVVDESGNLIAFRRMDGAKILSVTLAQDKAFTAAISRRGTHEYNALCFPGSLVSGIENAWNGRFSTVGGGYPVFADDAVVGGIGLSGGAPEQDMDCACAGLDAFATK